MPVPKKVRATRRGCRMTRPFHCWVWQRRSQRSKMKSNNRTARRIQPKYNNHRHSQKHNNRHGKKHNNRHNNKKQHKHRQSVAIRERKEREKKKRATIWMRTTPATKSKRLQTTAKPYQQQRWQQQINQQRQCRINNNNTKSLKMQQTAHLQWQQQQMGWWYCNRQQQQRQQDRKTNLSTRTSKISNGQQHSPINSNTPLHSTAIPMAGVVFNPSRDACPPFLPSDHHVVSKPSSVASST